MQTGSILDDDRQVNNSDAIPVGSTNTSQPQAAVSSFDGAAAIDTRKIMALELEAEYTEATVENTLQELGVDEDCTTVDSTYPQPDTSPVLVDDLLSHTGHNEQHEQDPATLLLMPPHLPELPELPHTDECPTTCYWENCSVQHWRSKLDQPSLSDIQPRIEIIAQPQSHGVPCDSLDALAGLHITTSNLEKYLQSKEKFEEVLLGLPVDSSRDFSLPQELLQAISTIVIS